MQRCAFQANFCFLKVNLFKHFQLENVHFSYLTPGHHFLPGLICYCLIILPNRLRALWGGSSLSISEFMMTVSVPTSHTSTGLSHPSSPAVLSTLPGRFCPPRVQNACSPGSKQYLRNHPQDPETDWISARRERNGPGATGPLQQAAAH